MARALSLAAVFLVGCFVGGIAQRYGLPGAIRRTITRDTTVLRGSPLPERHEVDRSALDGKRLIVAVCLGQSNAANYGSARTSSKGLVLNYHAGKLYRAEDPMLGATGDGGSPWPRLGDLLLESGKCEAAVFATLAVGGSSARQWAPLGELHGGLLYALRDLRANGLEPTHLLWQQGEGDRDAAEYRRSVLGMVDAIRVDGFTAPLYVSVATFDDSNVAPAIQEAQRHLVDGHSILAGPDTDQLQGEYRNPHDKAHFSAAGLARCSELWLEKVRH